MSADTVGRLAGDIAAQFAHLPVDEASASVEAHLRMFWDPTMRQQLVALVDARRGDLDPVLVLAADLLRGRDT